MKTITAGLLILSVALSAFAQSPSMSNRNGYVQTSKGTQTKTQPQGMTVAEFNRLHTETEQQKAVHRDAQTAPQAAAEQKPEKPTGRTVAELQAEMAKKSEAETLKTATVATSVSTEQPDEQSVDQPKKEILKPESVTVQAKYSSIDAILDRLPVVASKLIEAKRVSSPPAKPPKPTQPEQKITISDFKNVLSAGVGITNASALSYNREIVVPILVQAEGQHLLGWVLFELSPTQSKQYIGNGHGYIITGGVGWKIPATLRLDVIPKIYLRKSVQSNDQYEKVGQSFGSEVSFRQVLNSRNRVTGSVAFQKSFRVSVKNYGIVDEPQSAVRGSFDFEHQLNNMLAVKFTGQITHVEFEQYQIHHTGTIFSSWLSLIVRFGK